MKVFWADNVAFNLVYFHSISSSISQLFWVAVSATHRRGISPCKWQWNYLTEALKTFPCEISLNPENTQSKWIAVLEHLQYKAWVLNSLKHFTFTSTLMLYSHCTLCSCVPFQEHLFTILGKNCIQQCGGWEWGQPLRLLQHPRFIFLMRPPLDLDLFPSVLHCSPFSLLSFKRTYLPF